MKLNSKLKKILATGILSISLGCGSICYEKIAEAETLPLNIPVYEKVSIAGYPLFMLEEYYNESEKQLGHLPNTWEKHILVTDSMKFNPKKYGFDSDKAWDLATMQRYLGMKVGDGDKVKWIFE